MSYQILENYQTIRVVGADSQKFLQGQLTCDVQEADGSQAVLGGYCNVQGRLHATFYLLKVQDDFLLVCPKSVCQHLLDTLSKYAVFFDVTLNIDMNLAILALQTANDKQTVHKQLTQSNNLKPTLTQFALGSLTLLILDQASLDGFIEQDLAEHQASSDDLMGLQQIALGIPMVLAETIETLLPHYCGLAQNGGVNFEKGCYTGQEVVARMHYRGSLKTHPHIAMIEGNTAIETGADILNSAQKKVGNLINSAKGSNGIQALVSISDKALEQPLNIAGQSLTIAH